MMFMALLTLDVFVSSMKIIFVFVDLRTIMNLDIVSLLMEWAVIMPGEVASQLAIDFITESLNDILQNSENPVCQEELMMP